MKPVCRLALEVLLLLAIFVALALAEIFGVPFDLPWNI